MPKCDVCFQNAARRTTLDGQKLCTVCRYDRQVLKSKLETLKGIVFRVAWTYGRDVKRTTEFRRQLKMILDSIAEFHGWAPQEMFDESPITKATLMRMVRTINNCANMMQGECAKLQNKHEFDVYIE